MSDKEPLAARVEAFDKELAAIIRAPETEVMQVPAPFFGKGDIYRITRRLTHHPLVLTVGVAGDAVVRLADNPDGYRALARKAQLRLENDALRLAYLTIFLETTRSFAHRFDIVRDTSEIQPRPGLDDATASRFSQAMDRYGRVLQPPTLTGSGPWQAAVYALRKQSLVRLDLTLTDDGAITGKETVLEPDLPIPYTL